MRATIALALLFSAAPAFAQTAQPTTADVQDLRVSQVIVLSRTHALLVGATVNDADWSMLYAPVKPCSSRIWVTASR